MGIMGSILSKISGIFLYIYEDFTYKSVGKLYVDSSIPTPVLDLIRLLKNKRGWTWKGEFNNRHKDLHVMELTMYDSEGTVRIIQIADNGDVKYVYPIENVRFSAC
jgi:hypothetical protein